MSKLEVLKKVPVLFVVVAIVVILIGGVSYSYVTDAMAESTARLEAADQRAKSYLALTEEGLDELQAIVDEDLKKSGPVQVHITDVDGKTRVETQDERDRYAPTIRSLQEQIGRFRERLDQVKGVGMGLPVRPSVEKSKDICHDILDHLRLETKHHINKGASWDPKVLDRRTNGLFKRYYEIKDSASQ